MTSTDSNKKPLSVKIMETFGYRHVPNFTLQVINRNGRYHRAVDNTFVRAWSPFESLGRQVKIGLRVVDRTFENVMSRDGVPHTVHITARLLFDLRAANLNFAKAIADKGEAIIDGKATSLMDLALRRELSAIDSAQILQTGIIDKLEQALRKRLNSLNHMGTTVLASEDGLVISEILPPKRVQDNRNEATNIHETIDKLMQFDNDEVKKALVAHFLRDMGDQRPIFKGLNVSDDLLPNAQGTLDDAFRVLRQPTGRIYDN